MSAALDQRLAELVPLLDQDVSTELDAVEVAIAVEDSFGIVLGDDEIDPLVLGSVESIRVLVQRHVRDS